MEYVNVPPVELACSCWLICAKEEIGSKGGPPCPGPPDLLPGGPLGFNGILLSELFPPMGLSGFDIGPAKRGPPPPWFPGIPCCDCGLGIGNLDPAPVGSFGVLGPGL